MRTRPCSCEGQEAISRLLKCEACAETGHPGPRIVYTQQTVSSLIDAAQLLAGVPVT